MTSLLGVSLTPSSVAETPDERLAAASAAVRDPLWLLARQWQIGALRAEDGGSPIAVTMSHRHGSIGYDGRPVNSQVEPVIEAEPQPSVASLDTATSARMSSELFHLLADDGVAAPVVTRIRAALASAFPLVSGGASDALAPFVGRVPDARALYVAWRAALGPDGASGTVPPVAGITPADRLDASARAWTRWMSGLVGPPGSGVAPPSWSTDQVGYTFEITGSVGGQAVRLRAEDYDGAGVAWHTFDRDRMPTAPASGVSTVARLARPTRLGYPGMPEPGYWTIEDGNVNLDLLASDDPATNLLVAFAHSYSGDWFIVPLEVEPGVVMVTDLTVIDSFGTTTEVRSAVSQDGPGARFALWEIGTRESGPDSGAGLRVMLPSSPPALQGRPIEDVVLARDELANLGWLIELTTSDADGLSVDRYRRWLEARPEPAPSSASSADAAVYRLGTTLPDHWYPLEAADVGSDNHRRLRLAALPDGASEVSDEGVQGVTIDHQPGTAIDEEQVSRAGTRVRRVDRLTYTPTGRVVWRARHCDAGTGEATSGLRFDVIEAPDR